MESFTWYYAVLLGFTGFSTGFDTAYRVLLGSG